MTVFNRIAKNSMIHLGGKMVSLILGLVSIALMTRYLGQEKFGYYISVIAFLQFFGILADFGLTLTTSRMITKPGVDVNKVMSNIMTLRLASSVIFFIIPAIIIWFFPYNIYIKFGVLICVAAFWAITLQQTTTVVFQEKLKMLQVTIAEIIGRLLLVVFIYLVMLFRADIYWIFGAITISGIINLIIVLQYSRRYFIWKWRFDKEIWVEVAKYTWPIALTISFNLIYLKMDTIILSITRTQSEVGLYGASYRVVDILTMMPAVFMGIVLPVITRYFYENKKEALFGILQKTFDALMIFAVPIVLGTMIIGRSLMSFVAGGEFALSGEILKVLILASGAIFGTSLFGYAVVGVGRQKKMILGYLTAAVLTLIGYLIFIPKYGYWGAAWMTVFSEFLVMVWSAIVLYRAIKFFPSMKVFFKAVISAVIMTFVLYYFRNYHLVALLFIAVMVYFSFMYLLKGIKKENLVALIRK